MAAFLVTLFAVGATIARADVITSDSLCTDCPTGEEKDHVMLQAIWQMKNGLQTADDGYDLRLEVGSETNQRSYEGTDHQTVKKSNVMGQHVLMQMKSGVSKRTAHDLVDEDDDFEVEPKAQRASDERKDSKEKHPQGDHAMMQMKSGVSKRDAPESADDDHKTDGQNKLKRETGGSIPKDTGHTTSDHAMMQMRSGVSKRGTHDLLDEDDEIGEMMETEEEDEAPSKDSMEKPPSSDHLMMQMKSGVSKMGNQDVDDKDNATSEDVGMTKQKLADHAMMQMKSGVSKRDAHDSTDDIRTEGRSIPKERKNRNPSSDHAMMQMKSGVSKRGTHDLVDEDDVMEGITETDPMKNADELSLKESVENHEMSDHVMMQMKSGVSKMAAHNIIDEDEIERLVGQSAQDDIGEVIPEHVDQKRRIDYDHAMMQMKSGVSKRSSQELFDEDDEVENIMEPDAKRDIGEPSIEDAHRNKSPDHVLMQMKSGVSKQSETKREIGEVVVEDTAQRG